MSVKIHPSGATPPPEGTPSSEGKKKSTLSTFGRDVVVGSVAGAAAVMVFKPMMYAKIVAQSSNMKFEWSPGQWYKGAGPYIASFAPTTAIQIMADSQLMRCFNNPFISASLAGAFSSFVVCPAEGVLIQQKILKMNAWQTAKLMGQTHGVRGFFNPHTLALTMGRETGYTAAALAGTPWVKKRIKQYVDNDAIAQVSAGCIAGTAAAVVTHGLDTAKTRLQENLASKETCLQAISQKGSWTKGLGPRTVVVCVATTMIPWVREKLNAMWDK